MKQKLIIGVLSAAVILGGTAAVTFAKDESSNVSTDKIEAAGKVITAAEAEKIALSKAEGIVEGIEFESDFEKHYYEVDIEDGESDYDIKIDANTGEVLSIKNDDNDDTLAKKASTQNIISPNKAAELAEKAVQGKVKEMDRDEDDGQLIYEFELTTANGEVELELDAVTGKVLKIEYDN